MRISYFTKDYRYILTLSATTIIVSHVYDITSIEIVKNKLRGGGNKNKILPMIRVTFIKYVNLPFLS